MEQEDHSCFSCPCSEAQPPEKIVINPPIAIFSAIFPSLLSELEPELQPVMTRGLWGHHAEGWVPCATAAALSRERGGSDGGTSHGGEGAIWH